MFKTQKNEIQKIISESDLPIYAQDQVVELLFNCWCDYFVKGLDTHFETAELRDLWFYTKIKLLSEINGNQHARKLLSQLLDKNAKKYENSNYKVREA